MSELDDLLARVKQAPAPKESPRADQKREAMIRHALVAGRARHTRRLQLRAVGVVFGGLALAAACLLMVFRSDERVARDEAYELSLPSGDRMLALHEVRFQVESEEPMHRRVRLTEGAMLFDVAPLEHGSTFEVVTSTETIRVRGTVFVVEASLSDTSVRVFEGSVDVNTARGVVPLREGERYHPAAATERSASLEGRGLEAAARRVARIEPEATRRAREDLARRDEGPRVERVEPAHEDPAPVLESPPPVSPPVRATPLDERGRGPRDSREMNPMETPADAVVEVPEPSGEAEPIEDAAPPVVSATWLEEVHAAMVGGRPEEALRLARAAEAEEREGALDAEVDALRALSRFDEAAAIYDRMARDSHEARAAFQAAEIRFRRLHDAAGARASLALAPPLPGSPLRERSLALRAEIDLALGDRAALEATANAYLAEFPSGPRAFWMRARLSTP